MSMGRKRKEKRENKRDSMSRENRDNNITRIMVKNTKQQRCVLEIIQPDGTPR